MVQRLPSDRLPEASPYSAHLPALDGVRGLAVLAVMASHLFPGNAYGSVTSFLQHVLAFGASGVDLFFVLSGFLITGILYDSLQDPQFFRKFYARRVLRIFPLYYGVLAAYALASLFFGLHYNNQLRSMLLYLQNTHLLAQPIYAYAGPSVLPLAHFWSLAVEEQFYLVWPLFVYWLHDRRPLLLVCGAAAVLCPILRAILWWRGWSYYPVHMNTVLRADSLLTGAALALLLRSSAHDRVLRLIPGVLLVGGALFGFLLWMPSRPALAPYWPWAGLSLRYTAFDLLYAGLIAQVLRPGWLTAACRTPRLRSVGKYSYGLYVFHLILFAYLQSPLRHYIARNITPSKGTGVVLCGAIVALLSLLVAKVSFDLYEKRFLRLKRFFSYRQDKVSVTTAA